MPNKKQSARPAESGWLMATALLSLPALRAGVERFGFTLSELEELCRIEAEFEMTQKGYQGRLPWRSDVLLSAGINKGPDWDDEMDCVRVEELLESFVSEMEKEEKGRAGKGRDSSGNPRRTFSSWILPPESLRVILGKSDSEYRWKLNKELRAKSAILGSELATKGKRQERKVSSGIGRIIELSRETNRNKRKNVLERIARHKLEIEGLRLTIAGLRKSLKNLPEKLG
jgi:hypothetical protein